MGKILIVDDTLFMRTLLKNILFSGGHTIVGEAGDGDEAVEKYKELKPDLVTMDVVMPKMNGIESKNDQRHRSRSESRHVHGGRSGTNGQDCHKKWCPRLYR